MKRRRPPNRVLAALLAEADWSAGELARAVNALGTAQGMRLRYDRTSVAHWLRGSRPRGPVAELVARALGRRLGRPLTPADTGLGEPGESTDAVAAVLLSDDPVRRLTTLCRADADPTRRARLARSVVSAPPPVLSRWETPPPAIPHSPGTGRPTSLTDAARLETMASYSAVMGEKYGGAHGRPALALYLSEEVMPLIVAPAPPPVRRALLTGAAHLTLLLAAKTSDVGHAALAQHYYTVALGLAHAAGDRGSYAITLRCLSTQALRLGEPRQALALGEAALAVAGSAVPPATRAFLHAGRAVALAGSGRNRQCAHDLVAAEHHLARATGPDGPFTSYPQTALRYQRAEALARLGDHRGAVAELRHSLAVRPVTHHKAHALLHARLAHALLAGNEVEAAVDHCFHALRHCQQLATGSVHGVLPRLVQRLAPYERTPRVREFRERLRAMPR
ncbi:hypothetical protein ACFY12_18600 [Streptomyces sp. NPDC001339]|uniref:hypothetical protein n=1 Tax=Streptomyces sp. NPDC001339 TaxID=3364563 RepID=UPI0036CAA865